MTGHDEGTASFSLIREVGKSYEDDSCEDKGRYGEELRDGAIVAEPVDDGSGRIESDKHSAQHFEFSNLRKEQGTRI